MNAQRAGRRLAIAGLFAAGGVHWLFFFGPIRDPLRGPTFTVEDWPKEHRYFSVLQEGVRHGRVPLYISRPIHTRKFLAIPETTWSPQLVLLRWLSPGVFVVVNTQLLYAAGFVGCLLIRRRYALSLGPFAMLVLLFLLNGQLTSHIAVGHTMWAGALLLPFFFLLLLEIDDRAGPAGTLPYRLALVLFAILLQGAFHVFVWCLMLLGLFAAFNPRARPAAWRAAAWALALGACRLVPAFFLLNRRDQAFISGFPAPADVVRALLFVGDVTEPARGGWFGALRWWEYDTYVGAAAVAWLGWYSLGPGRRWAAGGVRLEPALAVMVVLSLGDVYILVNALSIPLLSAERVSSRFLLMPLLGLTALSAIRAQRHIEAVPRTRWLAAGAAAATLALLLAHSWAWRVPRVEALLPSRSPNLEIRIVDQPAALHGPRETAYELGALLSGLVSLGALGVLVARIAVRARAPVLTPVAPDGAAPLIDHAGPTLPV